MKQGAGEHSAQVPRSGVLILNAARSKSESTQCPVYRLQPGVV